jgi:hypothetical protein
MTDNRPAPEGLSITKGRRCLDRRPQLAFALVEARTASALFSFSKLNRLSRDVLPASWLRAFHLLLLSWEATPTPSPLHLFAEA